MKYIQYGTEFLDQLKDSVHDLYDENKELKKENRFQMKLIEKMNKNNDRLQERINEAIEYINTMPLTKGTDWYRIELLDILNGVDKE